jgi:colanic acid biosynthesis glycosyl transferase WcaI
MKVLLLNQCFYPDVVSTAQHASDLVTALCARGHEVTVVASRRAYDNPDRRFPWRETWQGADIRRVFCSGFGKKAKWRRAIDFGSFFVSCAIRVAFLPRFDVVISLTTPPLISVLGALVTGLKGGRFMFWVMDLNPDEALAAGWLRPGSLSARALEALSLFSFRRADDLVVLDRFMKERIAAKGIPRRKLQILPPWSHDGAVRYDSSGREWFRKRHGLAGKYVVMYSGNHSPCHPLDTLLEAARKLAGWQDIAFCFIGGGSEFKKVRNFAKQHRLGSVVTLPYQPLEELSASLSAADLHVVVMGEPFVGIIHPCKIYNILTIGAPVLYIGPAEGHITDVAAADSRLVLQRAAHGDVDSVIGHILDGFQVQNHSRRAQPAVTRFSQEVLISQIMQVIERDADGLPGAVSLDGVSSVDAA